MIGAVNKKIVKQFEIINVAMSIPSLHSVYYMHDEIYKKETLTHKTHYLQNNKGFVELL